MPDWRFAAAYESYFGSLALSARYKELLYLELRSDSLELAAAKALGLALGVRFPLP